MTKNDKTAPQGEVLEDIGYMKAKIETMEKTQDSILVIVKQLRTDMDEGKGARKALHWVYLCGVGLLALKFGDVAKLIMGK